MKIIVTRPQHDVTTKYLSSWAGEVITFAQRKGVAVIDLSKQKAVRKEFEGRVRKLQPQVIFLNGHGDNDCVTGNDNEELVKINHNHSILNNAVTYALACNSGKTLGPKVAEAEHTCYIGYADEFIFVCDSNYMTRPLYDPKAKPFMEASNQVMISLIKGNSARDASQKSKNKFKERYMDLLASDTDPDALQAAQFLWWNMRNQVCLGEI